MEIESHALFPTRLLTLRFPDAGVLNDALYRLVTTEFPPDFDMHPDSLNLLSLADRHPEIATLRDMFRTGLEHWLRAEQVTGELNADVVLFSNLASKGEYTLVHNHNADVVAVYYVRTPPHDKPTLQLPTPGAPYDYFDAHDGALVLHDPRFNANLAAVRVSDYARIHPTPGLMLVFPGYLWHSVTPYQGDAKRLAISANFRLTAPGPSNAEKWTVAASS